MVSNLPELVLDSTTPSVPTSKDTKNYENKFSTLALQHNELVAAFEGRCIDIEMRQVPPKLYCHQAKSY